VSQKQWRYKGHIPMPDSNVPSGKDKTTLLAEERTDLAVERTRLAEERTLMAWIRTSVSMIGFGFSIYKFFQFLVQTEDVTFRLHGPRDLGLLLIAAGTIGLLLATLQHSQSIKYLQSVYKQKLPWSLSEIIAFLICLIGVVTFFDIAFHIW
jgi:putative membrane protein